MPQMIAVLKGSRYSKHSRIPCEINVYQQWKEKLFGSMKHFTHSALLLGRGPVKADSEFNITDLLIST